MPVTPFIPLGKQNIADILGVSIRTVENLVAKGDMPAPAHVGARVLWHPDVFYTWLDQILRAGGIQGQSAGEHHEESVTTFDVAQSDSTSKYAKSAPSRPSATSRLQARQAKRLSDAAAP